MNKLTYLFLAMMLMGVPINSNLYAFGSSSNAIQRVRIDFQTPLGYTRPLLLAFTPDNTASDGFDYGYDALNIDNFPDDMNWLINEERYVIQGVGEFSTSKSYPLAMFLSNSGDIAISLNSLENFDTEIDIYVYDALLGTFTSINAQDYSESLTIGNYLDRFYLTFTNNISQLSIPNNSLSITETYFEHTFMNYLHQSKELIIDTKNEYKTKEITIYTLNAQELYKLNINTDRIKIPLQFVNSNVLIVKLTSDSGAELIKKIAVR